MAGHTAMTEEHSQRARPFYVKPLRTKPRAPNWCAGAPFVSAFANFLHQPAQQRFGRELRIRTRHGIAAQEEAVRCGGIIEAGDEAMQEEAVFTPGEHDLAGPDVFERAACDLNQIARPKRGQHAFAVNSQTHALTQTTAAKQNICHQS
jgi:hypothetical protein